MVEWRSGAFRSRPGREGVSPRLRGAQAADAHQDASRRQMAVTTEVGRQTARAASAFAPAAPSVDGHWTRHHAGSCPEIGYFPVLDTRSMTESSCAYASCDSAENGRMTCAMRPSGPTTKTTRLKNFFIGPIPVPVVAYFSAISPVVS